MFYKWGFVGCMGGAAFRNTPATRLLLRRAVLECRPNQCDDQVSRRMLTLSNPRCKRLELSFKTEIR